jgi:FtsP/CotA-like multicopper oxidase with cupredoxin domain
MRYLLPVGVMCLLATVGAAVFVACSSGGGNASVSSAVFADGWVDPPVFRSSGGELDLVMIAKPSTLDLSPFQPTGWVYEVCSMESDDQQDCPAGTGAVQPYGGVRLQVEPGDVLNIRLVNLLPPAPPDAEHVPDMPGMLAQNPTNLHTHGMIVEPRQADTTDPTYGDYIYVLGYPAGQPPTMVMPGLDTTTNPIDYSIDIPDNHPSGLYWFHPHVHGLTSNQITAGLAGIITVGSPSDYLPGFSPSPSSVRHLVLKDLQVFADGTISTQGDPDFCSPSPNPDAGEPPREGFCPGASFVDQDGDDGDYTGGRWFFTVTGQVYPQVHVNPSSGELWRLVNASASRTYVLQLQDDVSGAPLPMQVVSLDGVALDGLGATNSGDITRLDVVPCPGYPEWSQIAVCATSLRMMPSTRVELWAPPAGPTSAATLVATNFSTGVDGDQWPFVQLAHVTWSSQSTGSNLLTRVFGAAAKLTRPGGALATVRARFSGLSKPLDLGIARTLATKARAVVTAAVEKELEGLSPTQWARLKEKAVSTAATTPDCAPLAPGHHRRIYFGIPAGHPDGFGLGYEEIDGDGSPVPGTFQDLASFDGSNISICLPLAPGNQPAVETWELVNVSREDHNFHIHQTKFQVLSGADATVELGAVMDSVPVPHGNDSCDASIATWKNGTCTAHPVTVSIPFSQIGDFVYHCHILEHEDGGMMAHIRVIPSAS